MDFLDGAARRAWAQVVALAFAVLFAVCGVAAAAPGDLDPSFNGTGQLAATATGGGGSDMVLQPDGKIVVVGQSDANFGAFRLNPDGSVDTGFGVNGLATVDFGGTEAAHAVALQPDGKLVVAGSTSLSFGDGAPGDVAVTRLNPDGSVDASFSPEGQPGQGRRAFGFAGDDIADDVAIGPGGNIYLGGSGGASGDFLVVRMYPNGNLDTTYRAGSSAAFVDFGHDERAAAIAVDGLGEVALAGTSYYANHSAFAVARLKVDGTPDPSFGTGGKKSWPEPLSASHSSLQDGVLQPDGKLVVVGSAPGQSGYDLAVARLNPDGSFDPLDGKTTDLVDFGSSESAYAVALAPDGKILVGGYRGSDTWALARLQPGGALDTTFNGDGKATVSWPGSPSAIARAIALQPDGRILVGGNDYRQFAVARFFGDPPSSGPGGGGGGTGGGGGAPGGGGSAAPRCAGKRATIVGNARRNVLRGSRRADVIVSLGGNDVVYGNGGNDTICAGTGNDKVAGGVGNDREDGGPGNDSLLGQAGRDFLIGGVGNDRADGGAGNDRLFGGLGKDLLIGGSGNDGFSGGAGRDNCLGGAGRDLGSCEHKIGL
ncbi:MAG: hypothetical protein QOE65_2626 [Solirubrobacteraceae bacterium]|jgi:uncharacterized delta-60 repeat protein|nr:hypothetical protein [Solirubrobacteraceae bacterium]